MVLPLSRYFASFACGTAVIASLLVTTPARADAESDAKDLFSRARELRQKGDCATASPLFRKAYAVHPRGLGSLRNFAECEEAIGHYASARRAWLDLKRALLVEPPSDKYEGWEGEAEANAARLKPKVASFVVDVYVKSPEGESLATETSGIELFVNGESIGTKLAGTPLERDPGSYRIRAEGKDVKPVEQTVPLNAGDNPHVTLRVVRTPKAAPVAGGAVGLGTEPPAERDPDAGKTQRMLGWAAVGVGGAALVASGVTLLVRQGAITELDDQCPTRRDCDPSLQDTVDRGKLMSTLTTVLVPVGVIGVGAGVALIVTAPKDQGPRASGLTVSPTVRAGLGRIDATWRF